jgi:hypothetical protein
MTPNISKHEIFGKYFLKCKCEKFQKSAKCSKNAENSVEQGDIGHTIPNKVKLSLKAKEKLQVRYT